jgi:hypothetical protein
VGWGAGVFAERCHPGHSIGSPRFKPGGGCRETDAAGELARRYSGRGAAHLRHTVPRSGDGGTTYNETPDYLSCARQRHIASLGHAQLQINQRCVSRPRARRNLRCAVAAVARGDSSADLRLA